MIDYASRLFWWGERNKLNNFLNLTFDGGWASSGPDTPLGWTLDPTYGAGCQRGFNGVWGGCYNVIGDGSTATRGLITQSAVADSNGVARITANTSYSVRGRVQAIAPLTQGNLHVHLYSASGGINTTGLVVTTAQVNALPANTWGEFIAVLSAPLTSIPPDLLLRVYADGTPTIVARLPALDNIEIFPTYAASTTPAWCALPASKTRKVTTASTA